MKKELGCSQRQGVGHTHDATVSAAVGNMEVEVSDTAGRLWPEREDRSASTVLQERRSELTSSSYLDWQIFCLQITIHWTWPKPDQKIRKEPHGLWNPKAWPKQLMTTFQQWFSNQLYFNIAWVVLKSLTPSPHLSKRIKFITLEFSKAFPSDSNMNSRLKSTALNLIQLLGTHLHQEIDNLYKKHSP